MRRHQKTCDWCTTGPLAVQPGYFRDIDIDYCPEDFPVQIAICANCAGTGDSSLVSRGEKDLLIKLRFLRSENPEKIKNAKGRIKTLMKEKWEKAGRPQEVYAASFFS